ncbi:Questin oxidase [Cladobotryum mycophilum]|uniref:Questin oxidase n=1 Tax=Cladobotryum mycophilum TaxID=491253 RepID=A0ABR0SMV7_9HYPO
MLMLRRRSIIRTFIALSYQQTRSIQASSAVNMATAYHIQVPVSDTGLLKLKQNDETAIKVTELLQRDLKEHHVFFNASRFHNHIVHHLLALYGTGATPEDLDKAYAANTSYQLGAKPTSKIAVQDLSKGWTKDCPYLGEGDHYADFLKFFQDEIQERGILHPLIQLMYGIEWSQPTIIAQGLAQAAVHNNNYGALLSKIEKSASSDPPKSFSTAPELIESVRRNEKLANCVQWGDDDNIKDGVFGRGWDQVLELLKQVRVKPEEVEEKTAEMINSIAYISAATSIHPPTNQDGISSSCNHNLNASLFFVTISRLPFITPEQNARFLEWKIRFDIIQYIARGSPQLNLQVIKSRPLPQDAVSKPEDLLPRYHKIVDDGHSIKVVRSLLIAQELAGKHAGAPWIRFEDGETWLKVHYLLLKGAEAENRWVFSTGFEEAWEDIPKAK